MTQALVTGASSAIGRAIVASLATAGHEVIAAARSPHSTDVLIDGAHLTVTGDLASPAFVDALAAHARAATVLVHAAGHRFAYQRFVAFDAEDSRRLQAVDVDAFAALARRLIPAMMARRSGRIVAVTSLAASLGGAGAAPYAQAKAALEGLVRGLATDVGRFGVTVNAVAPGVIDTPRLDGRADAPDQKARLAQATSLKRLGTPADVAAAVRFLCSAEAGYVTGHTLVVDGGLHLANLW